MLGIAAFIGIFVATYYAYKTAKDYDRNPILWAAIVFAVGFGFQIIIPLLAGVILGIYFIATGTPPEMLEQEIYSYAIVINIVCIILSIIGMVLVLKHLGTVPDDDVPVSSSSQTSQPPPPPKFDGN